MAAEPTAEVLFQLKPVPLQQKKGRSKRENILVEILETEVTYVNNLIVALEVYKKALIREKRVPQSDVDTIFSRFLDVIVQLNKSLVVELQDTMIKWPLDDENKQLIGEKFSYFVPHFKNYKFYGTNYERATKLLHNYLQKSWFTEIMNECNTTAMHLLGRTKGLGDLLITPVQRVPRYELLLRELVKHTDKDHPDCKSISSAYKETKKIARYLNESMEKAKADEAWRDLLTHKDYLVMLASPSRYFVRSETIWLLQDNEKMKTTLYLFNDMVVVDELIEEHSDEGWQVYGMKLDLMWLESNLTKTITQNKAYATIDLNCGIELISPDKSWKLLFGNTVKRRSWIKAIKATVKKNVRVKVTEDDPDGKRRQGTYTYLGPVHGTYTGTFNYGMLHGQGQFESTKTGIMFEGYWDCSQQLGYGTVTYPNGSKVQDMCWYNKVPHKKPDIHATISTNVEVSTDIVAKTFRGLKIANNSEKVLKELKDKDWELLSAENPEPREFFRGQVILKEEALNMHVYRILEGEVEMFITVPDKITGEPVRKVLGTISAPHSFGEVCVFNYREMPGVIAKTDVKCNFISLTFIYRMCSSKPHLARRYHEGMAQILGQLLRTATSATLSSILLKKRGLGSRSKSETTSRGSILFKRNPSLKLNIPEIDNSKRFPKFTFLKKGEKKLQQWDCFLAKGLRLFSSHGQRVTLYLFQHHVAYLKVSFMRETFEFVSLENILDIKLLNGKNDQRKILEIESPSIMMHFEFANIKEGEECRDLLHNIWNARRHSLSKRLASSIIAMTDSKSSSRSSLSQSSRSLRSTRGTHKPHASIGDAPSKWLDFHNKQKKRRKATNIGSERIKNEETKHEPKQEPEENPEKKQEKKDEEDNIKLNATPEDEAGDIDLPPPPKKAPPDPLLKEKQMKRSEDIENLKKPDEKVSIRRSTDDSLSVAKRKLSSGEPKSKSALSLRRAKSIQPQSPTEQRKKPPRIRRTRSQSMNAKPMPIRRKRSNPAIKKGGKRSASHLALSTKSRSRRNRELRNTVDNTQNRETEKKRVKRKLPRAKTTDDIKKLAHIDSLLGDDSYYDSHSKSEHLYETMNMTKQDWEMILDESPYKTYKKGDVVLEYGANLNQLSQITRGMCKVLRKDKTQIGTMGAGDIFGDLNFLLGTPASATVVACEENTEVLSLNGMWLQILFVKRPHLAARFYFYIASVLFRRLHQRKAFTYTTDR